MNSKNRRTVAPHGALSIRRAARPLLEKVHGGRYRLYRSDEKGKGSKRGLELKIHDNRLPDGDGRSVTMLSGCE